MRPVLAFAPLFLLLACGSKSTSSSPADAGPELSDGAPATGDRVTTKGRVVDYDSNQPLGGVTIVAGDVQTTSDGQGHFSLSLLRGSTVVPVFTSPNYTKLFTEEITATTDGDLGDITFPKVQTFHLAGLVLPKYDSSLGVLYVRVLPAPGGSCADPVGATVSVASPANTELRYFNGKLPAEGLTHSMPNSDPVAVIYNIPPGSEVSFQVTHPTCKEAAFPYADQGATYTGHVVVTEGGDSNTAVRVYLE